MTLLEAVVVIFVIAFVALMLLPVIFKQEPQRKAQRINCTNNLKQLGLAYRIWEGDNHDQYPMELSVTKGGAKELMNGPDAWRTYQVMSNELSATRILICPQDMVRTKWATNFGDDLKGKISYFAGLDATETIPESLLSGDDNLIANGSLVVPGMVVTLTSNTPMAWDFNRHSQEEKGLRRFTSKRSSYGNIGLGDGSVQSSTSAGLKMLSDGTGLSTNQLAIP